MAENSAIEWTDHTFNPWIGCTRVSPGCDHCYAATQDKFRRWTPEGWGGPRRRTGDDTWAKPPRWDDRHAEFFAAHGRRQRVFCASLADVFDNQVPSEWRRDLFQLIAATPNLDWLLLTKRIGNAVDMIRQALVDAGTVEPGVLRRWPLPNVWVGATVVNQEEADRDIPKLLATPARVRFLSMEPLLGPVEFSNVSRRADAISQLGKKALSGIDWVIVGGESGPGARPMHPDWARSLRDQCAAAGVPFLFKQQGEWHEHIEADRSCWVAVDGRGIIEHGTDEETKAFAGQTGTQWRLVYRPGKKAAGRLLDGRTHDEFPRT